MHPSRLPAPRPTPARWHLAALPSPHPHDLSDSDLVLAVRRGDSTGYAELFRRHRKMADHVARRAGIGHHDADDVVMEAFAKVLRALRGGRGPTTNFPGYLATSVRRVAWAVLEEAARTRPTDDQRYFDHAVDPFDDPDLGDSVVAEALRSLPAATRTLLWRVEIEGHRIGDIAREDGKSSNSVSAATFRARKRLRTEYLRRLA